MGADVINWTRVSELRDEVGAEDFEEVVHLFLEEVEDAILRLRANTDPASRAADLHFLRGSAVSLGFATFSDLCCSAERKPECSNDDIDKILTSYRNSKDAFLAGLHGTIAA